MNLKQTTGINKTKARKEEAEESKKLSRLGGLRSPNLTPQKVPASTYRPNNYDREAMVRGRRPIYRVRSYSPSRYGNRYAGTEPRRTEHSPGVGNKATSSIK